MKKVLIALMLCVLMTTSLFAVEQDRQNNTTREINDSYIALISEGFNAGTTIDLEFGLYYESSDYEWLDGASLTFPAGVTVNSAEDIGDLAYNNDTGDGITVTWGDVVGHSDYGAHSGSTTFNVNVTINAAFLGDMPIGWFINGDGFGEEAHTVSGTITLPQFAPGTPELPILVSPAHEAMDISINTTLEWQLGEHTTDVDVYFSSSISDVVDMVASAKVVDRQNVTSYQTNNLSILTTYYWQVVSHNTPNNLVTYGPIWRFNTEAEAGVIGVTMGDGTSSNNAHPWNFYWKSSVAETIYLAEEINMGGVLTTISFFNNFVTNLPGKEVSIWVGETAQANLTNYIPSSDLTPVFSGLVDFPVGQNIITITLDTPYEYAGGNLVVLTDRPLDTSGYSASDRFYHTVTELPNRTLYWQSDSVDFNPAAMTTDPYRTTYMSNAILYFSTTGMGSVAGTVTDGTSGLGGVDISINGTNYHTLSSPDGSFEFPYIGEGEDYTLTASLHGYHDLTATFDVVEGEETTVNLEMVLSDNVTVSGQVIASDTGLGMPAHIMLTGYETYETDTDANGNFSIAGVFANQTYTGTAIATNEGYQPASFQAVVANVDLDLGTILVLETLFPASNVVATLEGNNAVVTWNSPNETFGESVHESFEESFPPANWTTIVNNTLETWARYETITFPSGDVVAPTDGTYQAGLMWDHGAQDEWLITGVINCPEGNLTFDYHGYEGSTHGDNYFVKITTDNGATWTPIWNASDLPEAENYYERPIVIDINSYAGQDVKFAWHFVDGDGLGLWYASYIDNINIGGTRIRTNELIASSKAIKSTNVTRLNKSNKRDSSEPTYTPATYTTNNRALDSYNVYRFLVADEYNMSNWTLVEEATTDTTYTDTGWSALDSGFYKYAVRAVYTTGAEAIAAKSNWLQNTDVATVTVNVDSNLGEVLTDAYITLIAQEPNPDGEYAEFSGVTNASGTAVISVNTDIYNITVTAQGFTTYSDELDVTSDLTLDVTLIEVALPPSAVIAVQEGQDALITWSEPGGDGSGEWITKGGEQNNDGVGTGTAAIIDVSQMYTEAELADYQGRYINSIKIFPRAAGATYTLKVWGGADGNIELYSQAITNFTNEAWNEYTLDSSVAIPATGPVYIGYNIDTPTGHPAGCDAGPAVPGGDLIKLNNQPEWDVLSEISPIDVNWNIQAYVSWSRGAQVASEGRVIMQRHSSKATQEDAPLVRGNLAPIANPSVFSNRALEGYKVWRLLVSDQGNEAYWTSLTTNMITDLTYTDTSWDSLPSGSYRFAVKAIYTNDNASPAAFSNILLKDMYGMVDGVVMDESNAPINNATVHFTGGTATTDASGYFLFTDVFAGDYEITASAAGYIPQTQNITVIGTQLTSVNFALAISDIVISDSFESYPDFAIQAAPWVMVDVDLLPTFGIGEVAYPNAYDPKAYIIFNHLMTTPPVTENFAARTGVKYAACFAADPGPNNDWMITEPINLADSGTFSFWGRSVVDTYGLERFNVLVSTGSTNPSDFVSISGPTYVEAPVAWTNFTYDLDAYANQTIRVAIQCVSNNAFMFMVDDVVVDAPGATDNENNEAVAISTLVGNYPNPFNPETTISFSTKESGRVSLDIYNIRGQKVRTLLNDHRDAGNHKVVWNGKDDNGKSVASGVFFYRMKSGKFSSTKKMILMK